MTKTEIQEIALGLRAKERRALADALLQSLDEPPLFEWQERALDKALENLERDPDSSRPAADVIAELREKHDAG